LFYIGVPCPICHVGRVGFCLCRDTATIGLMCMECESLWTHPDELDAVHARFPPHGVQRRDGSCQWASQAEIELRGWLDLIDGEIVVP
jgi:hypothetical protein